MLLLSTNPTSRRGKKGDSESSGLRCLCSFWERLVKRFSDGEPDCSPYATMAQDEHREAEALEWSEALISDAVFEDH